MALGYDTLRVELEEVEPGSRGAGEPASRHPPDLERALPWCDDALRILRTLSAPFRGATMHFVGVVDGERRHAGPTFLSPLNPLTTPPREEWAPGLDAALADLRREVEAAGWEYLGQGEQPWDLYYRRPRWA